MGPDEDGAFPCPRVTRGAPVTPESHSSERSPRLVICCHGNKVYKIYACFLKSVNSYGVSLLSPKGGVGAFPLLPLCTNANTNPLSVPRSEVRASASSQVTRRPDDLVPHSWRLARRGGQQDQCCPRQWTPGARPPRHVRKQQPLTNLSNRLSQRRSETPTDASRSPVPRVCCAHCTSHTLSLNPDRTHENTLIMAPRGGQAGLTGTSRLRQ